MNIIRQLELLVLLIGVGVCAVETSPFQQASGSAPVRAQAPPAAKSPRVFFVEPKDGATVKSPVHLRFGVENFQIAPRPQGKVEVAREGMGHHHVGIDTDCLPPGTVIEQGSPWVHFGDGKSEIDMQLTPGRHKLALEIGDDQHRTLGGLCTTINVIVSE